MPEITVNWLRQLSCEMRKKLEQVNLIEESRKHETDVCRILDQFLDERSGLAANTVRNYGQFGRAFRGCFVDRKLDSFTNGDADRFRQFCLRTLELGENTTRKRCAQASTFWRWMQRNEMVNRNIFDDVPKAVGSAIESKRNIEPEMMRLILRESPSLEWTALICLGRWGGIRVPSEAVEMQWNDINWETGRVVINSIKTKHQNKPRRVIPLFPEIARQLRDLHEAADTGEPFVFPIMQRDTFNSREPFLKMIRSAGAEPWPKLWSALRSTRETELAAEYPIHVVCEWMGNTLAVARKHYLKATDANFEQAAQNKPAKTPPPNARQQVTRDDSSTEAS